MGRARVFSYGSLHSPYMKSLLGAKEYQWGNSIHVFFYGVVRRLIIREDQIRVTNTLIFVTSLTTAGVIEPGVREGYNASY